MTRYTPSGQVTTIPQNQAEFEKIQTAINDTLSRRGDTPNGMEADLDMNSNRIFNLPAPSALTEPLRLSDLDSFLGGNLSIDLSSVTKVIDNVDTMKGDSTVNAGDVVFCKKYYSGGDLVEGLIYEIQSSGSADGYIDHAVVNGVAKLVWGSFLAVERAGFVADDSTDNQPALQSVLNTVPSGTQLLFGAGVYVFSSGVNVNTRNITFVGAGRRDTELKFTDGAYTAITTSTTSPQAGSHFTMRDLFLKGTTTTSPQLKLLNIDNNSPYLLLENCFFGFCNECLFLGETYVVKILNNQFNNSDIAIRAVPSGSQADCIIAHNTFGTMIDSTDACLDLQFNGVIVSDNYFETQRRRKPSVIFRTGSQRASLINNLYQVENGLVCNVEPSVTAVIANNVISASFDETTERVIEIDGGSSAAITGNQISGFGTTSGVGIVVSTARVQINSNRFDDLATGISSSCSGVIVGNTFTDGTTGISHGTGNPIIGFNEFNNISGRDIQINSGSPSVMLNIAEDVLEGSSTAAFFGNSPDRIAVDENFGQTSWNPSSIPDGGSATQTVTVTGAELGDYVHLVSLQTDLLGLTLTGYVSSANTVTVVLNNNTGGAVDLPNSTLRVVTRNGL